MRTLETQASISINAAAAIVWTAITSPTSIKKYLMGTTVKTDWKVGSPITYEGEYKGKSYKDKGVILKFKPCAQLQSTYWSSAGGKSDQPENYNKLTYDLQQNDGKTLVTLTQNNIQSEEEKKHVTENWKTVLLNLKKVVEGTPQETNAIL